MGDSSSFVKSLAECQQKQWQRHGYKKVPTAISATAALLLTPLTPMQTIFPALNFTKFHTFENYSS